MTLSDLRDMFADLTAPAVIVFLVLCAVVAGSDGCHCGVSVTSKEAR